MRAPLPRIALQRPGGGKTTDSGALPSSSYFHERQYRQMAKRFPDVKFKREHDFKNDLLECLRGHDHVFFMVDDNIFVKDFLLKDIIGALDRNPRAIGFSLRLGRNMVTARCREGTSLRPNSAMRVKTCSCSTGRLANRTLPILSRFRAPSIAFPTLSPS